MTATIHRDATTRQRLKKEAKPQRNPAADEALDGSLWAHNKVDIRAEMRVGGLAITRSAACIVVDLTTPTTV